MPIVDAFCNHQVFPQQLVSRIAAFAMEPPITLNDLEPAQKDVQASNNQ